MIKKLALVAVFAATASFASWDYLPILDAGRGQVEVNVDYTLQGKKSQLTPYLAARHTIIQNLEVGVMIPYVVFTHYDGEDLMEDGFDEVELMARYQFLPMLGAYLDIFLPTCDEDVCGDDDPFAFRFGVQFYQKFGMVQFGSELGLMLETEGEDKKTPPWDLKLGLEASFHVNEIVEPYVGVDLRMKLGKDTYKGKNVGESRTGDLGVGPFVGATVNFTSMFYAALEAQFCFGDDYYGNKTKTLISGWFGLNF